MSLGLEGLSDAEECEGLEDCDGSVQEDGSLELQEREQGGGLSESSS